MQKEWRSFLLVRPSFPLFLLKLLSHKPTIYLLTLQQSLGDHSRVLYLGVNETMFLVEVVS